MAAPTGNKFAVGNSGGRPPIYADATVLTEKIIEFFEWCKGESHTETRTRTKIDKETKQPIIEDYDIVVWDRLPEQPNITNLALFLGFDSRQSFYDYGNIEEFSYTIKRARLAIENYYEDHLLGDSATGAIFALKNFGWNDKTQLEHSGKDGGPIEHSRKVNYDDLTDEELEIIIARGKPTQ